ncbi:MAG TPA: hypothetical protein VG456_18305 [Candidatus Sulfopaludibacter sp.]|nr:hypothetical protein [Candidatus Sulfopaludibacter sp.]
MVAPSASTFEERHQSAAARNPADLLFVLHTAGKQTAFHQGERIPIVLAFSSSSTDKYKLDSATYDRSGRLRSEEYVLDRDDAPDPLADYFGSGVIGGMAGGIRGMPVLGPEPVDVELSLNDWFRFDRPGHYRVFVKSRRITREALPGETTDGHLVGVVPVSNILEFDILPADAAWEAAKLAGIQGVFDTPGSAGEKPPKGIGVPYQAETAEYRRAVQELSYLGTTGAVRLILVRARMEEGQIDSLGLIRSPHRAFVEAELDRFLTDPETVITQWDVRLRALLDYVKKYPEPALPLSDAAAMPTDWGKIRRILEPRQAEFEAMVKARAVALIPAVARKSGQARESSAEAMAALAPESAKAALLVPPDDFGMSRADLIARFPQLPAKWQAELLGKKWALVRGPEMVDVLLNFIRNYPAEAPEMSTAYNLWHGASNLPESALARIDQLSPEAARRVLLADVASATPRFAAYAMLKLEPQSFSSADATFKSSLEAHRDTAMPLIAHFGSTALIEAVHDRFPHPETLPCAMEEPVLLYFLRISPEEGARLLKQSMAARERRGCYRVLLGGLSSRLWNGAFEKQSLASLDDPDPEVAASAAQALAARGSAAVEPLLWRRLEQWSEKWRGKAADLRSNPITGTGPNGGDDNLGSALNDAISSATAWLLDEPRKRRLVALCIDDVCRQRWDAPHSGPITVKAANGGAIYGLKFQVDDYQAATLDAVRAKLTQYPTGTRFQWCAAPDNDPFDQFIPEEKGEMYASLVQFLAARGMTLAAYKPDACQF